MIQGCRSRRRGLAPGGGIWCVEGDGRQISPRRACFRRLDPDETDDKPECVAVALPCVIRKAKDKEEGNGKRNIEPHRVIEVEKFPRSYCPHVAHRYQQWGPIGMYVGPTRPESYLLYGVHFHTRSEVDGIEWEGEENIETAQEQEVVVVGTTGNRTVSENIIQRSTPAIEECQYSSYVIGAISNSAHEV